MTSDYQSGASAMRELAAKAGRAIATENYRPLLGSEIEGVILALALPAAPVSSEGADRRLHEARVHKADIAEIERQMDVSIAARDAEIDALTVKLACVSASLSEKDQREEGLHKTVEQLSATIYARDAEIALLRAAMEKADEFITNGIELGFIRMPDESTPDSAHETPKLIRAAVARKATP